jgi:hypothetical protein
MKQRFTIMLEGTKLYAETALQVSAPLGNIIQDVQTERQVLGLVPGVRINNHQDEGCYSLITRWTSASPRHLRAGNEFISEISILSFATEL